MISSIYPPLDGEAAERFPDFVARLAAAQRQRDTRAIDLALAEEAAWCQSATYLADGGRTYEACIRILTDLVRLRWRIVEQGHGYALENPKELVGSRPAEEIVENKRALRDELRPVVEEQRRHPAVSDFIRKMEQGDRFGRKSVLLLVASGAELADRLAPSAALREGNGSMPFGTRSDPTSRRRTTNSTRRPTAHVGRSGVTSGTAGRSRRCRPRAASSYTSCATQGIPTTR